MDMQNGVPSPDIGSDQSGGYCIEIYVGPNNKVTSVKVEQKAEEDVEEAQPGADQGGMQEPPEPPPGPSMTIQEALGKAMELYQAGGKDTGPESPEDAAQRGYNKASGGPRGGLPMKQVFGE